MNKNLLIFNEKFFSISETFIYNYIVGSVKEYNINLLSNKWENRDIFPLQDTVHVHRVDKYKSVFDKYLTILYRKYLGHSTKFSLYYQFYIRSILKNTPIDLIHAHYGTNGITILPYASKMNVPLVVTFHGYDASKLTSNKEYIKSLKDLFEYASAIIVVSPHMVENLKLDPFMNKVHLVPYGIDTEYFKPNSASDKSTIGIIHFGRLVEKKGVPDLIKVFSKLVGRYNNIKLHIVGNGPKLNECRQVVSEMNITADKVVFYGAQPPSVIKKMVEQADIFVLNSRTAHDGNMEGMPNSILEAMSMEKAVVSTYHAGIPYVIRNGYNGLMVPENDNKALEAAIEKLCLDRQLRTQLGRNARQTVLEKFTVQIMQSNVNAIYKSILQNS
jgi:colanic acid/amylovoran biosynthesis glycosyltransferase